MSRSYQTTGIILKGMPFGEADRLVTLLSPEFGLIRAIAPGARKLKSRLRGRTELFVINQLLIIKGRSLDKITQVQTLQTYPRLSQNLGKLAASQYLAELILILGLSEQPQDELYQLLTEHLTRLEQVTDDYSILAHLAQAVFHLLVISGIAPQVQRCCLTQETLEANFSDRTFRVGFSFEAGGLINLTTPNLNDSGSHALSLPSPPVNSKLGAVELTLLQHLGGQTLPQLPEIFPAFPSQSTIEVAWVRVERMLRDYAQYHLGRSFRAATLVDSLLNLEF